MVNDAYAWDVVCMDIRIKLFDIIDEGREGRYTYARIHSVYYTFV